MLDTMCGDDGERSKSGRNARVMVGGRLDRATRPSLEILPSRWGEKEREVPECVPGIAYTRTLRNYVRRWRGHVVSETMGTPYGERRGEVKRNRERKLDGTYLYGP